MQSTLVLCDLSASLPVVKSVCSTVLASSLAVGAVTHVHLVPVHAHMQTRTRETEREREREREKEIHKFLPTDDRCMHTGMHSLYHCIYIYIYTFTGLCVLNVLIV